jgi:hypothetical protein
VQGLANTARGLGYAYKTSQHQNVPYTKQDIRFQLPNIPSMKHASYKVTQASKHPNYKISQIENIPSLKTSQASKHPKPQNVLSLKISQLQNNPN